MVTQKRLSRFAPTYVLAIVVVHGALLVYGIFLHGPGWDEVGHLPAGISHWKTGRFDLYRVNPPLARMVATAPLAACDAGIDWYWEPAYLFARPEWDLGAKMIEANGPDYLFFLRVARLMCLPFAVLAIWVVWRWSSELFGPLGGMLSVTVWGFSPFVLTNAQMITPDTAAAAFGALACFVFRRWLMEGTLRWAFLAGVSLGLAELTKFTWVILFGVWPLQWLLYRSILRMPRFVRGDMAQLLLIFAVGIFVINTGYGFEGTLRRLGDYQFFSKSLGGTKLENSNEWIAGNRFRGTVLAALPIPLPENMINGIDRQKLDFESNFVSYLRGEWRDRGWYHFYLYGILVKEPTGFLFLSLCALYSACRLPWSSRAIAEAICVLLPGLTLFVFVSSQTGFNHHVRYVLPAMIFFAIGMGVCGQNYGEHRLRTIVSCVAVVTGVIGCLIVYPHTHAFFNSLAGGPLGGPRHLMNSDLDWGQDLLLLRDWAHAHPDQPLDGYVSSLPRWLGISELTDLPREEVPKLVPGKELSEGNGGPVPGRFAVTVKSLHGRKPGYGYFRELTPVARVGYTVWIYELSLDDANRIRKEAGLPMLP